MGGASKLPAALKERPRPLPKWAPGMGLVIVIVVLFFAGGVAFLLCVATIKNGAAQFGLGVAAVLMFLFAALFPGNVKRQRELLANGPATIAEVTAVRNVPSRYGSNGRYVAYTFEVNGKEHAGEHPVGISDPRFPGYPKPGDAVFIIYDAKEPSGRSILWGPARD